MSSRVKDRFDSVPDDLLRTGAHRGPKKAGRGWIAFAWAALATGLLVVAGLFGLSVVTGKSTLSMLPSLSAPTDATPSATPSPSPSPTVVVIVPKIDPALPISVLNGTVRKGLAGQVGDYLVKQGWAGASASIGSRANAASTTLTATVVYYNSAAYEAAARAMLLTLKVGTMQLSAAYPQSPISVALGSDFTLP